MRAVLATLFATLTCAFAAVASASPRPNFIFVLTDDQDLQLGGELDMPVLQREMVAGGMTFDAGYVTTPICCPSRTATMSGLYAHNLGDSDPRIGWCGDFTGYSLENETWINALHENGYTTSLSGKYHNSPPINYTPKGYDDFFVLVNECQYFNNQFNLNGKLVTYGNAPSDYMTSVIGNHSIEFLKRAVANVENAPFFAYVAPHAPHMPSTSAPWYEHVQFPISRAPRTPAYNASGVGKQWLTAELPPLTPAFESAIDFMYGLRHRALLSVDDILAEIFEVIAPVLNNTYVVYSSDHGYNLGTFRLAVEKFHLLENDISVPFHVRGPGIAPGSRSQSLVANIDIGATILDLAGVPPTPTDGRSFAAELRSSGNDGDDEADASSSSAIAGAAIAAASGARDRLIIEYWGSAYVVRGPCNASCGICAPALSQLMDAPSNTYSGLRIRNTTHDVLYAEFRPFNTSIAAAHTNWTELYDLRLDPFQLVNLALSAPNATLAQYSRELFAVATCELGACP